MKKNKAIDVKEIDMPSSSDVALELERVKYKSRYGSTLRSTVFTLVTVAAIAVLVSMLLLPVIQIYGSSMSPTVSDGDIVVAVKGNDFETGDVIAFYYNNKVLIKRVIAQAGEWVDVAEDGTLFVNNERLDEPYITDKAYGETNIRLPYQVPEGKIFVVGDHRSVSIDSRNTSVGCVSQELILGKVILRIWPLSGFGALKH